ncbi:MAG: 30S ribosome-binding factor RbfA [Fidelibacterota bacterium]
MKQELPYNRPERVGQQLLHILGDTTTRNIDLSHLGFITFTRIIVSPDLKYAKVFFSVLAPKGDIEQVTIGLNQLRKAFRKYVGQQLRIKNTPELRFYFDESSRISDRIEQIIHHIHQQDDRDSEY